MKTQSILKLCAALMIFAGIVGCQNTDRSGNAQIDTV